METESPPVSFEAFVKVVAKALPAVQPEAIAPQSSFYDDLYADSLQMLGVLLRVEELGVQIPVEAAWRIRTVGEFYQTYLDLKNGG